MDLNEEDLQAERALSLRNYSNLEPYGIEFLTGEACAMGERLLFDLTMEGKEHIERFFGGSAVVKTGTGTNPGSTASILLPSSVMTDLALNIVWNERPEADWLLRRPRSIWTASSELRSLNLKMAEAVYADELESFLEELESPAWGYAHGLLRDVSEEQGARWVRGQGLTDHPRRGDKNVHAVSGETHPA